jgi:hypothetical protein
MHTFVAWNPVLERGVLPRSAPQPKDVAILRASVVEGRSYFARLAFGEWDEHGPRELYGARTGLRYCFGREPALVRVDPSTDQGAAELANLLEELEPRAPDLPAGQAWLVENADDWELHKSLADARFRGLSPRAKQLATLDARGVTLVSAPKP